MTVTRAVRGQERRVAQRLMALMPRMGRLIAPALRGAGVLSFERLRPLFLLDAAGSMRSGELAYLCGLTPSGMTVLVDAMIEAGLLSRREDPDDRRAVVLEVTAAGREELRAGREIVLSALSAPIRALGPDGQARLDAALAELEAALERSRTARRATP